MSRVYCVCVLVVSVASVLVLCARGVGLRGLGTAQSRFSVCFPKGGVDIGGGI